MKRLVTLALLLLLIAAGIGYGPELVDYYRFDRAVQASSKEGEADAGPWPAMSDVCMPCHGNRGNAVDQHWPRLAGQPEQYTVQQLTAFASGEHSNSTMSPLALTLSADDIAALAAYFARQDVGPNSTFVPDRARRDKGATLAKTGACASCHGPDLGGQGAFPRLAGQGYDYLVKQLSDFKTGLRNDRTGAMAAIVSGLSDDDMADLAHFISSHPTR